jgi:hypothetical protein
LSHHPPNQVGPANGSHTCSQPVSRRSQGCPLGQKPPGFGSPSTASSLQVMCFAERDGSKHRFHHAPSQPRAPSHTWGEQAHHPPKSWVTWCQKGQPTRWQLVNDLLSFSESAHPVCVDPVSASLCARKPEPHVSRRPQVSLQDRHCLKCTPLMSKKPSWRAHDMVVKARNPEKCQFSAKKPCVPLARKGKLCSHAPPGKLSHATVCQHWGLAQSALWKRQFLGGVDWLGAGHAAQGCSKIHDTPLTALLWGLLPTNLGKNGHPQHQHFKANRSMSLVCSGSLCAAPGEGRNVKHARFQRPTWCVKGTSL